MILLHYHGQRIFVRPDMVTVIIENGLHTFVYVLAAGEDSFQVDETAEEIVKMIEKTLGK